jgi:hypothetical protein
MTRGVTHLRGFLRGRWRLERRILDRRLGECGFLVGSAEYRDDEGGLSYHEEGTLSFGGDCFPVSRGYRYRFPDFTRWTSRRAPGQRHTPVAGISIAGGFAFLPRDPGSPPGT